MKKIKSTLGLIVNPISGMGGRVGLKGTDTSAIIASAISLGAKPESTILATICLQEIHSGLHEPLEVICPPGIMGENAAEEAGFSPTVLPIKIPDDTSAEDTRAAVQMMASAKVSLILFAGGDGTARDIYSVIKDQIPVVGIPAGVKMHSAVYATTPKSAARLVSNYFASSDSNLKDVEVMDIDEDAFRNGQLSASLYGYMKVPFERRYIQGAKSGGIETDESAMSAVAHEISRRLEDDVLYILGPGTTLKAIGNQLGVDKTLLGVDLFQDGKLIAEDVTNLQIEEIITKCNNQVKIIVTPIGGQGHIFGRGNQQISPSIIKRLGREAVIIVATTNKLASLNGRPFLVDTGDPDVDQLLSGYIRVVTGVNMESVYRVSD